MGVAYTAECRQIGAMATVAGEEQPLAPPLPQEMNEELGTADVGVHVLPPNRVEGDVGASFLDLAVIRQVEVGVTVADDHPRGIDALLLEYVELDQSHRVHRSM